MRNRYLLTRSGGWLGSRVLPFLYFLGPILLSPLVLVASGLLELGLLAVFGFLLLISGVVLGWVFLLKGGSGVKTAGEVWVAGDYARAIPLCQSALATVFRSDVRTKAFHILGLCAEANGDFVEALDLFDRVIGMV